MNKEELIQSILETMLTEDVKSNPYLFEDGELKASELIDEYTKDQNLRTLSDFSNYKKKQHDQEKLLKSKVKFKTLSTFIEILDDWAFFTEIVKTSEEKSIKEGFNLINKKMDTFLSKNNLEEVPTNIVFNEDLHECVSLMDSKMEKGTILKVISKGYKLNEQILRYPKVIVQS